MRLPEPIEFYHTLEKALNIIKHEGQEPWFDIFYSIISKRLRVKQRDNRGSSESLARGREVFLECADELGHDWKDHIPVNEKGENYIFDLLSNRMSWQIDQLSLAHTVLTPLNVRLESGIFHTPQILSQFIAEAISVEPGERTLELGCGTAPFLQQIYRMISLHYARYGIRSPKQYVGNSIIGIEQDPLLCTLARANLRYPIKDGVEKILCKDALDPNLGLEMASFDNVFTNPPFGSKVTGDYLDTYNLGYTQRSEDLFIERTIRLVRPDGRIALILSEEIFENERYAPTLDYLAHNTQLLAEYRLPRSTFILSGTNVKTRLLLLRRTIKPQIFKPLSVDVESVGHSMDGRKTDTELLTVHC